MQVMLISHKKLVLWINKDHHEFGILFWGFNPLMPGSNGIRAYLKEPAAFSCGFI